MNSLKNIKSSLINLKAKPPKFIEKGMLSWRASSVRVKTFELAKKCRSQSIKDAKENQSLLPAPPPLPVESSKESRHFHHTDGQSIHHEYHKESNQHSPSHEPASSSSEEYASGRPGDVYPPPPVPPGSRDFSKDKYHGREYSQREYYPRGPGGEFHSNRREPFVHKSSFHPRPHKPFNPHGPRDPFHNSRDRYYPAGREHRDSFFSRDPPSSYSNQRDSQFSGATPHSSDGNYSQSLLPAPTSSSSSNESTHKPDHIQSATTQHAPHQSPSVAKRSNPEFEKDAPPPKRQAVETANQPAKAAAPLSNKAGSSEASTSTGASSVNILEKKAADDKKDATQPIVFQEILPPSGAERSSKPPYYDSSRGKRGGYFKRGAVHHNFRGRGYRKF